MDDLNALDQTPEEQNDTEAVSEGDSEETASVTCEGNVGDGVLDVPSDQSAQGCELQPNDGKTLVREVEGVGYMRLPIRTHVVTGEDFMPDVAEKYAGPHLQDGDTLFISEKAVSCSQKRAVFIKDIKPRRLAVFLCKFVYKSPYGIGLSIPPTMEMALRECGIPRILFAAFVSAIGKLFRRRGWFYKIAGYKARSIDGPTPNTLPPYNECVVLGPAKPDQTAKDIADRVGCRVCIVDLNDIDGVILGVSDADMDRNRLVEILRDNPLGQSLQQTPMGIIRAVMGPDKPPADE